MNTHDKANLEFLLAISPGTLRDWFNAADPDDIEYAKELLATAFNMVEREKPYHEPLNYDPDIDCTAAGQLLAKFTLKGTS